jgi:hypothetical protein
MRADCLIRVRWQQRMLSSEVKENTSPTESEVSWHVQAVHGQRYSLSCDALRAAAMKL